MGFNYKIIAVDFDGTLCENKWPEIGAVNESHIYIVREEPGLRLSFGRTGLAKGLMRLWNGVGNRD